MLKSLRQAWRYVNPFENPKVPLNGSEKAVSSTATVGTAGVVVTESSAMTWSPVWAAVDLISAKIAELPWVWQRRGGMANEWLSATEHPTFDVLAMWAGEMTPSQAIRQTGVNLLMYGNGFAWMVRNRMGQMIGLRPIHPYRVQMYRLDGVSAEQPGELWFQVSPVRSQSITRGPLDTLVPDWIHQDDMLHLRHMAPHGHWGLSPIFWNRRSVGRGMAGEEWMNAYYGNDAIPGGVFTPDEPMETDEYNALLAQFEQRHGGPHKAHRLHVSQVPGKWHAMGSDAEKGASEVVATSGVRDAARMYRLPSHYLQDPTATAYNSNVEEGRRLLRDTLNPWLSCYEAEALYKMPAPSERGNYRARFDRSAYTRGELTASDLRALVEGRILTPNEARERLGENPIEGGNTLVSATHVQPISETENDTAAPIESATDQTDQRHRKFAIDRSDSFNGSTVLLS